MHPQPALREQATGSRGDAFPFVTEGYQRVRRTLQTVGAVLTPVTGDTDGVQCANIH